VANGEASIQRPSLARRGAFGGEGLSAKLTGGEKLMVENGEPSSTKGKSAVEVLLEMVRECHSLAHDSLTGPKPDRAAANRYMRLAGKAGRGAAPYIRDQDLRQRIVADKPMSEEEWEKVGEILRTDPNRLDLRLA
jgi:hypothetical protein